MTIDAALRDALDWQFPRRDRWVTRERWELDRPGASALRIVGDNPIGERPEIETWSFCWIPAGGPNREIVWVRDGSLVLSFDDLIAADWIRMEDPR